MKSDREKWDDIYAHEESPNHPSAVVKEFHRLAKRGTALDIAAGNGRNAKYLAEKGFVVDAVDISTVGLQLVGNGNPDVRPIRQDLDFCILQQNRYDLVVTVNYLNRRLFPFILDSLKSGGFLIYQTFLWDRSSPPRKREPLSDHYLRPNELLHSFLALHIHRYTETKSKKPKGTKTMIATLVGEKRWAS